MAANRAAKSAGDLSFVRLESISKTYGDVVALDDVSLDIAEGEFLTLLGPSGSGKTTCLRAIAGMSRPDAGRLSIAGRDVSAVPMNRRNIGMVFQNYSLFPHLSVAQNVGYPLRVRRIPAAEAERRVGEALELVRLSGYGARRPSELSGGQQQRVALARALVFEPDVLLLDEPLSALDRVLREEMQLELRRIHREIGTTMICVTHDRSEALTMSDRIVVMRAGRIVQDAPPESIYLKSGSRFVAEFLGEVNVLPMTLGDGALLRDAAGRPLAVETGELPAGPVDVVARVEHVRLTAAGNGRSGEGEWRGIVTEALFLGDAVRFVVDCAPHTITARLTLEQARGIRPGDAVTVDFSGEPPMVFEGTGER
ncbi:ABC transporter ATP-binding protein [Jiella sonneratiae]|uniref:ABC transporter ATP-binding protein n=1 Tax=Jiella sonneratiae TaxID=2816856 RepID=A0ABS3J878_9HYPH|nr:ABC transporter ATP-binding protein [Jiella sonneratiae]MBO0904781.1 ABC transporter ATP-binding protein [Jiella sonneratiae]